MIAIFQPPDPLVAFDRALGEKRRAYAEAQELARRVFFLRAQREGEITERRVQVARLHDRARAAARAGDKDEAAFVLDRKRRLIEAIAEEETALAAARADAREAQRRLLDLGEAIDQLVRDRRSIDGSLITERLHATADRPLPPRVKAALERARDRGRSARDRVDMERAIGTSDDLSLDLERRTLM